MKFLYKNWFVHNTLAHPLHELLYLTMRLMLFGKSRSRTVSDWLHDVTLPVDGPSALTMLLHDKEATTEKIREKLKAEKIEELKEQKERYATQMAAQDWYA